MSRRLDVELVDRGLAPNRSKAQALILAGVVRVNASVALKAGAAVDATDDISIDSGPRFVSRGGEKLDHALDRFEISLDGAICADIGASTGGFTDVMLQRGAARVYAIDVGYGQLALSLRADPRVIVMDRTNARYLQELPERATFVAVDASFISLGKLFPAIVRISEPAGMVVTLIKPQFEAGRGDVGKRGVVRDASTHARVLRQVIESADQNNLRLQGLVASPIKGPAGNIEFLGYFQSSAVRPDPDSVERWIDRAIAEAPA